MTFRPGLLYCNPLAERLIQPIHGVTAYVLQEVRVAGHRLGKGECTSKGTRRGTFMGVEPTNKELSWTGITIDRIAQGRIDRRELG